jgi:O-antigen/teichoic acid export membrane protein
MTTRSTTGSDPDGTAAGGQSDASLIAPSVVPTDLPRSTLDRSLVTGVAWTGGIKWLSQILSWLATLVVARILSPTDYGIAGMAVTYVGLVQLVSEFGLSAAVVQQRDLTTDQIARLGGLSVGLGVIFALLSVALAAPVAAFFGESALQAVVIVMSTTFVIGGLQVLPRSLLTRDLRFRTLGLIEGAEAVVLTGVTITLALMGFGYWALVIGGVASRLVATILMLVFCRHRLAWPRSLDTIAVPLRLGAHVLVASLLWYAFRSADMAVIGRVLGSAALGAYAIGFNIASVPAERLAGLVTRTTPAIFAAVQHDPASLRRYLLGLTEGIAIVTMPVAIGLALVADEFVVTVLGAKWQAAVPVLQLLALAGGIRSIIPLLPQILIATGQARRNTQASVALALTMPVLFLLASRWGITGVAWVWVLVYPAIVIAFMMRFALAACATTGAQYARSLWPSVSGCAIMAAAVIPAGLMLPADSTPGARLAVKVAVGVVTYVAALSILHTTRVAAFLRLVRFMRAGQAPAAGSP